MKSELVLALNQICADRNLPRELIAKVVESALAQSFRKHANVLPGQEVAVKVNIETGNVQLFIEKEVVEKVLDERTEISLEEARKQKPDAAIGDCIMVDVTPNELGRIAAQNTRQLIVQKLREAERDFQYNQFADREGEVVVGIVQNVTNSAVTLSLGRVEGILPRKEQMPGERYTVDQRVRAYVQEVKRSPRGLQIILSRTNRNFLRRLLEVEVPEIRDGVVEIKAIVREPGSRSKVAVAALQPNVDPVGVCVGVRGSRIQPIVNELHGEKIDIIEWSADPAVFVTRSLGPAKVMSVHPTQQRGVSVIVPDDQLSLAIGREGQNARLAARLTGLRIDIRSTTEALAEALDAIDTDPAFAASLGEDIQAALPALHELRVRQRVLSAPAPLSAEEFALIKRVVDAHFAYQSAHARLQSQPSQAQPVANQEAPAPATKPTAANEAPKVPSAAYALPISELGLSPRVAQHIYAVGIVSVGQLMELSLRGEDHLLAIEGIGPRALGEIKQALEKVVGQWKAEPSQSTESGNLQTATQPPAPETTEEAQQIFVKAMSSESPVE